MPLDNVKSLRVVRLNQANMPQAQSIFFRAYQNNPLLRYYLNDSRSGFDQRLRGFIRAQLSSHYRGNNIALAIADEQRLVGAILIDKTRKPHEASSSWSWRFAMYSVAGVYYTEQLRSYYREIADADQDLPYYWISLMGLHPDYQHHGYGHKLMMAATDDCRSDNEFRGFCIDSSSDVQKQFFESLNYSNIAKLELNGLNVNLMHLVSTPEPT